MSETLIRINTQTHSHKLRAGSHKLPETQQEVFFCGQKLSQLEQETGKDTLIRLHRWWQVGDELRSRKDATQIKDAVNVTESSSPSSPPASRSSHQSFCRSWPWTPSSFLWMQYGKDPVNRPNKRICKSSSVCTVRGLFLILRSPSGSRTSAVKNQVQLSGRTQMLTMLAAVPRLAVSSSLMKFSSSFPSM